MAGSSRVAGNACSAFLFSILSTLHATVLAQVDDTYVGGFGKSFSARTYGGYSFTSLTHRFESSPEETYVPNVPPYFGLGAHWNGIGGSFSYGLGFANPHKKEERSKYLDLQLHYYGDRIVFDFFGQRYKGFSIRKDDVSHFYSDVGVMKWGGFLQYNINYKRFSYPAAFSQSKRQLQSAGTLLVSLAFYYARVYADSTFAEGRVGDRIRFVFGPSAGYAYSFVFGKHTYATGSLSFGVHACVDAVTGKGEACPTMFPRMSWVYMADTWALAVSAQYNLVYVSFTDDDKLALGTLDGQIAFTKRFDLAPTAPGKTAREHL